MNMQFKATKRWHRKFQWRLKSAYMVARGKDVWRVQMHGQRQGRGSRMEMSWRKWTPATEKIYRLTSNCCSMNDALLTMMMCLKFLAVFTHDFEQCPSNFLRALTSRHLVVKSMQDWNHCTLLTTWHISGHSMLYNNHRTIKIWTVIR